MKKFFILKIIILSFFLNGCSFPWQKPIYSAIQITSVPGATVYIDGQEKGKTPYASDKIMPGEHQIKLTADSATFSSWEQKVKFTPKIWTVINRILGPSEILSSGEIITMEPINDNNSSELAVVSNPDGAKVVVDNQDAGLSPFAQKNIAKGKHEVIISMPNYTQRLINIDIEKGYRLIINAQLAQILSQTSIFTDPAATNSATISAFTEQSLPQDMQGKPDKPRVKVLETPTGWLRVRSGPGVSSSEIGKVYPDEYYAYLDEQAGWVKIRLKVENKDAEGWISVQYVSKEL